MGAMRTTQNKYTQVNIITSKQVFTSKEEADTQASKWKQLRQQANRQARKVKGKTARKASPPARRKETCQQAGIHQPSTERVDRIVFSGASQ